MLKLIRAFLESGVMVDGLTEATEEGVPQGGPVSPVLSNVVLDELDKELERRGLGFVRFADDIVIYVALKHSFAVYHPADAAEGQRPKERRESPLDK